MVHVETTLPLNVTITCKGFPDEDTANRVGYGLLDLTRELGKHIDLSILSVMTIAYDDIQYKNSIKEVNPRFSPSEGDAVGVAMSIGVLTDDGSICKHIVFKADLFAPYFIPKENFKTEDELNESIQLMIHTVAHECAHVEATDQMQKAFPYEVLKKKINNMHEEYLIRTLNICWDEYIVCYMSSAFGHDPLAGYFSILESQIKQIDERIQANFKDFLIKNDFQILMDTTFTLCSDLMKFSSYVIGTLRGQNLNIESFPIFALLKESWFFPYFQKLDLILENIHISMENKNYDFTLFEHIANLLDEICLKVGLITQPDGKKVFVRLTEAAYKKTILDLAL